MLSIVWGGLILASLIFGILTGNISDVTQSISIGVSEAISLVLTILGLLCFWSGIMEILIKSGLIDKISTIFKPILSLIFKKTSKDTIAMRYITSNFIANLLGLSNAATPMGLKAADRIYEIHGKKGTPSDLVMLIVINCSSIQLIPTTVAAIRANYGATNPFDILPAVWITSVISVLSGILMAKLCEKGGL